MVTPSIIIRCWSWIRWDLLIVSVALKMVMSTSGLWSIRCLTRMASIPSSMTSFCLLSSYHLQMRMRPHPLIRTPIDWVRARDVVNRLAQLKLITMASSFKKMIATEANKYESALTLTPWFTEFVISESDLVPICELSTVILLSSKITRSLMSARHFSWSASWTTLISSKLQRSLMWLICVLEQHWWAILASHS